MGLGSGVACVPKTGRNKDRQGETNPNARSGTIYKVKDMGACSNGGRWGWLGNLKIHPSWKLCLGRWELQVERLLSAGCLIQASVKCRPRFKTWH